MAQEAFEGIFYSLRKNKEGMVISFVVHPSNIPEELVLADIGQRCIVSFVPYVESGPVRADERGLQAPTLPPQGRAAETKLTAKERYAALPPEKQAIADAAMLAGDVSFQMWATERAYAMGLKFDTAKDFIHDRCAVASCSEFATDPKALQRWNGFRAVFDEWRRG